jgi:hypothetical protein
MDKFGLAAAAAESCVVHRRRASIGWPRAEPKAVRVYDLKERAAIEAACRPVATINLPAAL